MATFKILLLPDRPLHLLVVNLQNTLQLQPPASPSPHRNQTVNQADARIKSKSRSIEAARNTRSPMSGTNTGTVEEGQTRMCIMLCRLGFAWAIYYSASNLKSDFVSVLFGVYLSVSVSVKCCVEEGFGYTFRHSSYFLPPTLQSPDKQTSKDTTYSQSRKGGHLMPPGTAPLH